MRNYLLQGDCIETMKEIPEGSVDMVLGDLPYGTTQCKWDSVIDLEAFWEQVWRVTKPSAAVVLTAQGPFTMVLGMSQIRHFKYKWVWRKARTTNYLNAKKQPLRCHEDVLVFRAGTDSAENYFPQITQGKAYTAKPGSRGDTESLSPRGYDPGVENKTDRYPVDVLDLGIDPDQGLHPTQKPVALGRYMIRTYTKPGDLVLDPTCGSGSFLKAAQEEGRDWLGIEREDKYIDICRERLGLE